MPPTGAPPNLYQNMASMPGPMPQKPSDNTEELMKGFHGLFKAMAKMESMNPGLKEGLTAAKKSMKEAVANVLKADPSTLEEGDGKDAAPPAAAPPAAPPPPDAPPAPGAGAPPA